MFGRYQPDSVEHSKSSLYNCEIKGNLEYISELFFLVACPEANSLWELVPLHCATVSGGGCIYDLITRNPYCFATPKILQDVSQVRDISMNCFIFRFHSYGNCHRAKRYNGGLWDFN